MSKYNHINKNILQGDILIHLRKLHVKEIASALVINNIISYEYLDNLIKLKMEDNILIDNTIRIELLNDLLQKECSKYTAKLINDLTNA